MRGADSASNLYAYVYSYLQQLRANYSLSLHENENWACPQLGHSYQIVQNSCVHLYDEEVPYQTRSSWSPCFYSSTFPVDFPLMRSEGKCVKAKVANRATRSKNWVPWFRALNTLVCLC